LLRADPIDQAMADAGQVQVSPASQLFEFIEELRRGFKGKQAGLSGA
jgi:hypothetical protein